MQLGMIGLGRMGANLVRRVVRAGHEAVVYDVDPAAVAALTDGTEAGSITGAASIAELVEKLSPPRAVWVMVPAAHASAVVMDVGSRLEAAAIVIDGGNSYYRDDITRADALAARGVHH